MLALVDVWLPPPGRCSVVLVGDPQQLPATILSELAKQVGGGGGSRWKVAGWRGLLCLTIAGGGAFERQRTAPGLLSE